MRDRLIELISKKQCRNSECAKTCSDCASIAIFDEDVKILADYLLENGVIVPPCKVGDTMYDISEFVNCVPCPEMYEDNVTFITIMNRKNGEMYFDIECVECDYNDFGKTIFFTKEEAEQALSKLQASYEQVEGGD